jgi:hypothetical protein
VVLDVVVVVEVVELVLVVLVGVEVLVVEDVVELVDVVELLVEVVVVVEAAPGGVTVRAKLPWYVAKPSTTMKYVCPAVTVGVIFDPRCGFVPSREVAHPVVSSLQATSIPDAHDPCRR